MNQRNKDLIATACVVAAGAVFAAYGHHTSEAPMVVDGVTTKRDGAIETHSAYCIPANTTPFGMQYAAQVREVAIDGSGDDLPQHAPCPAGRVIDTF